MTRYLVNGFSRANHKEKVAVIVEGAGFDFCSHAAAEAIAGPAYCFAFSSNISEHAHVPEDCKNVLFMSNEELYARVPDLDNSPKARARRTRAKRRIVA